MSAIAQYRRHKDHSFKHDPYSPIPAELRAAFTGLNYFPENEALDLVLPLEKIAAQETIVMQTSTGDTVTYTKYGRVHFEVDGQPQTLTLYQASGQHELFLPFADATTGRETYGGGRYLEVQPLGDETYQVDFNMAYNPFCAYSPDYSCPLPPFENHLKVAILAGEKDYKK